MSATARIIDANMNRAREALRVMEDAARFALDDATLCGELKALRHDLRTAVDALMIPGVLEANRDTAGDVGTEISTAAELQRSALLDVIIAAGKRLTESLRVIEEMSKVMRDERSGDVGQRSEVRDQRSEVGDLPRGRAARASDFALLSARFEAIRYRAYDLDSRLQLRFGSGRAAQWKLCLILTLSLCKRPWREVLRAAIEGGCDCVQVREKDMDGGDLVRHVREVMAIAKPPAAADLRQAADGAAVIVNDRVDVALAAGADGVHLGQSDLSVREARRLAGRSLIVGVSTHDLDEACGAVDAGADYCGVGAMFATSLKPHRQPSGPAYLKAFIERFPNTPHLAIGGITPDNVHLLHAAGARGIAVSSALCAADEPRTAMRSLRQALAGSGHKAQAAPATAR